MASRRIIGRVLAAGTVFSTCTYLGGGSDNFSTLCRGASTYSGGLFAWGNAQYGQLGLGLNNDQMLPNQVQLDENITLKQISAGGENVVAVDTKGQVYTWGRGLNKVLGLGDDSSSSSPQLVFGLADQRINQVSASSTHVLALDAQGVVYSWGNRALGYTGDGLFPEPITTLPSNITSIAAGKNHSLAMDQDGKVYSWGAGYEGALGLNSNKSLTKPTLIHALQDTPISQIVAGSGFSLFLSKSGQVYSCGANDYGQTAQGNGAQRYLRVLHFFFSFLFPANNQNLKLTKKSKKNLFKTCTCTITSLFISLIFSCFIDIFTYVCVFI